MGQAKIALRCMARSGHHIIEHAALARGCQVAGAMWHPRHPGAAGAGTGRDHRHSSRPPLGDGDIGVLWKSWACRSGASSCGTAQSTATLVNSGQRHGRVRLRVSLRGVEDPVEASFNAVVAE